MKGKILALLSRVTELIKKSKLDSDTCITINDLSSEQHDLHSRVKRMRATINGEDKWMLTLKERH